MARVLIIDDEAALRAVVRESLEREGFEVVEAGNGAEGLALHREHPADVIVTDIFMPEKDGYAIIQELQREFPDTKVIVISGGGGIDLPDNYLDLAKRLGVRRTLSKPFQASELVATVREVLGEAV